MIWHVQYSIGTKRLVAEYDTPELAIESACSLIDGGYDVYGIGTGPLTDSIARNEIGKIYALWAKGKRPRYA